MGDMIHADDIEALASRAHAALVSMPEVCKRAGMFRQSWYRARKRGRMEYEPYRKLLAALASIEAERTQ